MWPYRTMIIVATPDQSTKSYGEQYRCQQLRELQRTNAKRTRKRPDTQAHTQNAKRTRKRQTNTRTQNTQNAKSTHTKRTDTRAHTQNAKPQNAHTRENDTQHTQNENTRKSTQTHTRKRTHNRKRQTKTRTRKTKHKHAKHTRIRIPSHVRILRRTKNTAHAKTRGRTISTTRFSSGCFMW